MSKPRLRCSKCKKKMDEDEFAFKDKKRGRRLSWCRACNRAYQREHYKLNRQTYRDQRRVLKERRRERNLELVIAHLSDNPCADCGEPELVVLEFDHVRGKKFGDIANLVAEVSTKALLAEIAKCEVRCANCHRRKTARERGWTRKSALQGAMF
jgi:hypothetical protein